MAKQLVTISSGAITVTGSYCRVEGEGGSADELTTINGGTEGQVVVLESDPDTEITVQSGTNIYCNTGGNRTLQSPQRQKLTLIYDGSEWHEIAYATPKNFF
jgi:hypothetical protein